MPDTRPVLTLAHSPDPDDAFMWWPITGKVDPGGRPLPGKEGEPRIDTGRFRFRALPADIEALNRRTAERGDLDITALSARAWADVAERYVVTACGGSFGEGYGPKVVARAEQGGRGAGGAVIVDAVAELRLADVRIAVPGKRTTAFLVLGLVLGTEALRRGERFVEMPFERIIGAVARGEVEAGLVIHEGQLTFADAGLRLVVDTGAWWKEQTGLALPLGVNAVRRDLDARFGAGTILEVSRTLRASVEYALAHRREALEYTMPFAMANAARGAGDGGAPTMERVDRYVSMYVTDRTVDMGKEGREAIRRLLEAGAEAGLCPRVGRVETV